MTSRTFRAGQTFLYPISSYKTAHLWVIATDPNPDGFVLIVSLTSLAGSKDQTVILHGGEHPFLKWATSVAYSLADLVSCEVINGYLMTGEAKMHSDMSKEKIALILDGFTASMFTKKRIVTFVKAYKEQLAASAFKTPPQRQ